MSVILYFSVPHSKHDFMRDAGGISSSVFLYLAHHSKFRHYFIVVVVLLFVCFLIRLIVVLLLSINI